MENRPLCVGWDLEDDSLLDTDLGFTKCDDMDTKRQTFLLIHPLKANYIDLPYGYISLKDTLLVAVLQR